MTSLAASIDVDDGPAQRAELDELMELVDGRELAAASWRVGRFLRAVAFGGDSAQPGPAGPAAFALLRWGREGAAGADPARARRWAERARAWRAPETATADEAAAAAAAVRAMEFPDWSAQAGAPLLTESFAGFAMFAATMLPETSWRTECAAVEDAFSPSLQPLVSSCLRGASRPAVAVARGPWLAATFRTHRADADARPELEALLCVHAVHLGSETLALVHPSWRSRLRTSVRRTRGPAPSAGVPGWQECAPELGWVPGAGWCWDGAAALFGPGEDA